MEIEKGKIFLTGETTEGIDKLDQIVHPYFGDKMLIVDDVLERRDSKSFPKGNNMHYEVKCAARDFTNEEIEIIANRKRK